MQHEQAQIHEFMVKAEQTTPDRPTMPDFDTRVLRVKLIWEELFELIDAYGFKPVVTDGQLTLLETAPPSLRDAYDAVLDLLVVTIGAGVAMGTRLEPGWEEVHRSNMSKFIDGYRRADGKWIKGPSYSPTRLQPVLDAQTEEARMRDGQTSLPLT